MEQKKPDDIYTRPPILAIIGLSLGCIFLGFFLNFSIEEKILALAQGQLEKNAPCPLKYQGPEIIYFFPGLHFKDLRVPSNCTPNLRIPLTFDHFDLQIKGLSFSTFRPIISFEGKEKENLLIRGNFTSNGQDSIVNLKDTKIDAQLLSKTLTSFQDPGGLFKIPLKGNLIVNTAIKLQNKKLQRLAVNLFSNDLTMASFKILGMNIPALDIGNLQVITRTTTNGKKLILDRIALGGNENSIEATLEGEVDLADQNFLNSQIRAKVKFRIAKELLEEGPLSMAKIALKKFHNELDGLYHINITNTLGNMQFQELSQQGK